MRFLEKLTHLFIPRESNNHKARVLHPAGLLVLSSFFIFFQFFLNVAESNGPNILGYSANISIQDIVNLTNQKRAESGLSPLSFNQNLSNAAYTKGRDMIDRDYWAHVSPDGTEPWAFFKGVGYKYRYAGENLARDFSTASDTVNAWMSSPTHRENIMNPKYKEIGIGITEGDLAGSDTTIVVQFFGTSYADKVVQPVAQISEVAPTASSVPTETVSPAPLVQAEEPVQVLQAITTPAPKTEPQVLISPFTTTRNSALIVVSLLLLIFMIDAYLVQKRKITRIAGRTFAHIIFLFLILAIILILKTGKVI